MTKREQVLTELRIKYRTKWLNEAIQQQNNAAKTFVKQVNQYYPNTFDIDNGKDITDYSDSEGGEVIVINQLELCYKGDKKG